MGSCSTRSIAPPASMPLHVPRGFPLLNCSVSTFRYTAEGWAAIAVCDVQHLACEDVTSASDATVQSSVRSTRRYLRSAARRIDGVAVAPRRRSAARSRSAGGSVVRSAAIRWRHIAPARARPCGASACARGHARVSNPGSGAAVTMETVVLVTACGCTVSSCRSWRAGSRATVTGSERIRIRRAPHPHAERGASRALRRRPGRQGALRRPQHGRARRAEAARRMAPGVRGRVVMVAPPYVDCFAARCLARWPGGRAILGRSIAEWISEPRSSSLPVCEIGVIAGTGGMGLGRLVARGLPKPNDGVVALPETHVPGMRDHLVLPVSHTAHDRLLERRAPDVRVPRTRTIRSRRRHGGVNFRHARARAFCSTPGRPGSGRRLREPHVLPPVGARPARHLEPPARHRDGDRE